MTEAKPSESAVVSRNTAVYTQNMRGTINKLMGARFELLWSHSETSM
jgi:hypothetical protein